ncbi:MAG: PIN domain-containing protein [Nitrospirae bacterium]|nr:PIN domain-containing protein [Nitrospirota bacterium]
MVLVDTSVWIDFFQHPESVYSKKLEDLIKNHNRVILCGIILQEILQGIRDERSYGAAKKRLSLLP